MTLVIDFVPFPRKVDRVCISTEKQLGNYIIKEHASSKHLYYIDGKRTKGETGNYWANDILISSTLDTNVTKESDTLLRKIRSWQYNVYSGECCTKRHTIGIKLTSNIQDSIQIKSINHFELKKPFLKSDQFKDTLTLKIEFTDDYETNGTLYLKVTLSNDTTKENYDLVKDADARSLEKMNKIIQWPIILKYLIQNQKYRLTIDKPDESKSIYLP